MVFIFVPFIYGFIGLNVHQVQDLKKTLKSQTKELNDCRAEITSLKMLIEGARSGKIVLATDSALVQSLTESHSDDIKLPWNEVDMSKAKTSVNGGPVESVKREEGNEGEIDVGEEAQVNDNETSAVGSLADLMTADSDTVGKQHSDDTTSITETVPEDLLTSSGQGGFVGDSENDNGKPSPETDSLIIKSDKLDAESNTEKMVNSCSSSEHANLMVSRDYFTSG